MTFKESLSDEHDIFAYLRTGNVIYWYKTLVTRTKGPAVFDVNFHSLLIEVWSMVNSQIPLLTGHSSVDVELLQKSALSIPGYSVEGGI